MLMFSWLSWFLKMVVFEPVCIARQSHFPMRGDVSRFLDGINMVRKEAGIAGVVVPRNVRMNTACERCGAALDMTYSSDDPESYWVTES